jgi:hypothetical protein
MSDVEAIMHIHDASTVAYKIRYSNVSILLTSCDLVPSGQSCMSMYQFDGPRLGACGQSHARIMVVRDLRLYSTVR